MKKKFNVIAAMASLVFGTPQPNSAPIINERPNHHGAVANWVGSGPVVFTKKRKTKPRSIRMRKNHKG